VSPVARASELLAVADKPSPVLVASPVLPPPQAANIAVDRMAAVIERGTEECRIKIISFLAEEPSKCRTKARFHVSVASEKTDGVSTTQAL
jgi:hypothetical protein